ncbi:thioredoxin family protein [Serinicoccus kebangsaanensis]|uniref:thioredoxin family protein n=1 Tax=Serinicoccus kebangsaanensis TaxID=2602069 RepID=UPI001EE292C5|nr:thioredoxin family protein [Serinicoccus kebangsaanensis]
MTRTPVTTIAALATALVLASCGSTDAGSGDEASPASTSEDMASEEMDDEMASEDTDDDMASEDMDDDMASEDMDDDMTSEDDMDEGEEMDEEGEQAMPMSGYVDHGAYAADPAAYHQDGQPVVLFFHADWCPDCRATDESLTTDGVPEGLTVVKVDYDTMTDLRQTYGVTQQHTFVQVDAEGAELGTWTGVTTGEEILAQTEGS